MSRIDPTAAGPATPAEPALPSETGTAAPAPVVAQATPARGWQKAWQRLTRRAGGGTEAQEPQEPQLPPPYVFDPLEKKLAYLRSEATRLDLAIEYANATMKSPGADVDLLKRARESLVRELEKLELYIEKTRLQIPALFLCAKDLVAVADLARESVEFVDALPAGISTGLQMYTGVPTSPEELAAEEKNLKDWIALLEAAIETADTEGWKNVVTKVRFKFAEKLCANHEKQADLRNYRLPLEEAEIVLGLREAQAKPAPDLPDDAFLEPAPATDSEPPPVPVGTAAPVLDKLPHATPTTPRKSDPLVLHPVNGQRMTFLIGRDAPKVDHEVPDGPKSEKILPQHARLTFTNRGWTVSSYDGPVHILRVDGFYPFDTTRWLRGTGNEVMLKKGDRVQLGEAWFEIALGEDNRLIFGRLSPAREADAEKQKKACISANSYLVKADPRKPGQSRFMCTTDGMLSKKEAQLPFVIDHIDKRLFVHVEETRGETYLLHREGRGLGELSLGHAIALKAGDELHVGDKTYKLAVSDGGNNYLVYLGEEKVGNQVLVEAKQNAWRGMNIDVMRTELFRLYDELVTDFAQAKKPQREEEIQTALTVLVRALDINPHLDALEAARKLAAKREIFIGICPVGAFETLAKGLPRKLALPYVELLDQAIELNPFLRGVLDPLTSEVQVDFDNAQWKAAVCLAISREFAHWWNEGKGIILNMGEMTNDVLKTLTPEERRRFEPHAPLAYLLLVLENLGTGFDGPAFLEKMKLIEELVRTHLGTKPIMQKTSADSYADHAAQRDAKLAQRAAEAHDETERYKTALKVGLQQRAARSLPPPLQGSDDPNSAKCQLATAPRAESRMVAASVFKSRNAFKPAMHGLSIYAAPGFMRTMGNPLARGSMHLARWR